MRRGIDAACLVADIRAIARVLRNEAPTPELEFVEHTVPVKDDALVMRLEERLDDMLGEQRDGRVAVAVLSDHWDDYGAAQAFATKDVYLTDDFSLEYVLNRVRVQRAGTRFAALRDGTVTLYAHTRAEKGNVI
ncbi:TIGR04141 family sporadically distributed protein [Streptomyces sp. 4R-3d]|uniref:TIGR04141 family sporadically distributed protein n=1 Tax=Streptomyces sp. 4R-3d TaxID=2559605 RepID=UPI001FFE2879|nr:TIGR04141 family sporadically distributed protein [Streptomyces sp. 4R-3d]